MYLFLEKTLCTTPSVSKKVGMDSENYSVMIQSIGSHSAKSTVLKVVTLNDGFMINVHVVGLYHKCHYRSIQRLSKYGPTFQITKVVPLNEL